jgi:hypothetical protein
LKTLDIELTDLPFEPDARDQVIKRRRDSKGRIRYKVWLILSGADVIFVKRVTYVLHRSFGPKAIQTVDRSVDNPDCRFPIWTWGLFQTKAVVETKDQRRLELIHYLQYNRWLRDPSVRIIDEPPL